VFVGGLRSRFGITSRTKLFAFVMGLGLSGWHGQELRPRQFVKER